MDAPARVTAADEVCSTEAERACLAELRVRSGQEDGPVERHGIRLFAIAERLANDRATAIDREVVLCSALLHDAGLYDRSSRARFYLARGRAAGEGILMPFGWAPERKRICLDAIELHHRLVPQWDRGTEVELVRIADLVDGSGGIVRAGLERDWLRDLFRRIPRHGLYRELLRHSLRGAPCLSGAVAGSVAFAFQRDRP